MKYFIFFLKEKIRIIPVFLTVIFFSIFCFYIFKDFLGYHMVNVEICFEKKDFKNNLMTAFLKANDSTKSNANISISYDREETQKNLDEDITDVAVFLPEGFYESIINGENKKAEIVFSKDMPEIKKSVFKILCSSLSDILKEAQINIYISDFNSGAAVFENNKKMNDYLLEQVLSRDECFEFDGEEKSNVNSWMFTFLLMISTVFVNYKNSSYISLLANLKVRGKSIFKINILEILSDFVFIFLIMQIGFLIFGKYMNFNFSNLIIKPAVICFFTASLTEFLYFVFGTSSSLAILILGILSFLNLGIVFPKTMMNFKMNNFMPTNLILTDSLSSYLLIFIYSAILTFISDGIIRRKI